MTRIFISYRHDDSAAATEALDTALKRRYGAKRVFRDNRSIPAGDNFPSQLEMQLGLADVVLVVIGSHWLGATDAQGNRRLDNPADFVHREVGYALTAHQLVVPVLLDGALMPPTDELLDDLKALTQRQAAPLRSDTLADDVKNLMRQIDGHLRWRFPHPESLFAAVLLPIIWLAAWLAPLAVGGSLARETTGVHAGVLYVISLAVWFFGIQASIRKRQWEWLMMHLIVAGLATALFLGALVGGQVFGFVLAGCAGLAVSLWLAAYGLVGPRRPGSATLRDIMRDDSTGASSSAPAPVASGRPRRGAGRRVMVGFALISVGLAAASLTCFLLAPSIAAVQVLVGTVLLIPAAILGFIAEGFAFVMNSRNSLGMFGELAQPGSDWAGIAKKYNRRSGRNVLGSLALGGPVLVALAALFVVIGLSPQTLSASSFQEIGLLGVALVLAFPIGVLLFALVSREKRSYQPAASQG